MKYNEIPPAKGLEVDLSLPVTLTTTQGPPISLPLPPTSRDDLQLDSYLENPMSQRHYAFTNIHAFSGIRTQALRHSSQRRKPLYRMVSRDLNTRPVSEANPQVYVETPLHPEKLTVWYALWAGGIIGP
ncbi:hypothetical protein TNCV_758041 [Trichonephila clavipes]|nr:hypothetical protein TNCV_758041 [Trichonephila clavipes]